MNACPDDLLQRDDARQGGILDQGDDLVGHGRNDPLDHLQQGDLEEYLSPCHTKHQPRLFLTDRHSLDPSAVYLGEVTGVIQYK